MTLLVSTEILKEGSCLPKKKNKNNIIVSLKWVGNSGDYKCILQLMSLIRSWERHFWECRSRIITGPWYCFSVLIMHFYQIIYKSMSKCRILLPCIRLSVKCVVHVTHAHLHGNP